jgi:rhodanese-related sulfurtransferase
VPETQICILLFDTIQLACGSAQSRFDASARLFSVLYYLGFSHVSIICDPDIHSTFPGEFATQYPDIVHRLRYHSLPSEPRPSNKEALSQNRWLPKHQNHFFSYEMMFALLAGKLGQYRLLDARSAEEHDGIFTGYDYVPLAGKIPTSENVINGDYQVLGTEKLAAMLAHLEAALTSKGIGEDDRIVWYCGTGWRASRMCALSQALGYSNVGIYDGGWYEWQQKHPENGTAKPWGIEPSDAAN